MITLTRRQARCLRGVFRRHALGITGKGPVPPLVLRAEGSQLRAQHRYGGLAVEHVIAGDVTTPGVVALPLDALADFEGRDDVAGRRRGRRARPDGRSLVRPRDPADPRVRRPRRSTRWRRSPTRPPRGRSARPACSTRWPRRPPPAPTTAPATP